MKPNPPYLATIVIAVVLMVIGLSLEGSLISIATLNQAVGDALAAAHSASSFVRVGRGRASARAMLACASR